MKLMNRAFVKVQKWIWFNILIILACYQSCATCIYWDSEGCTSCPENSYRIFKDFSCPCEIHKFGPNAVCDGKKIDFNFNKIVIIHA